MNGPRLPDLLNWCRTRAPVRLVLAWFVLFFAAAVLAPQLGARSLGPVCSAGGLIQIAEPGDAGSPAQTAHGLDCPLCVAMGALPTLPESCMACLPVACAAPLAREAAAAGHAVPLAAAPLPPRGPPAFV
ncbi:MAG: DUF2946 domain-containing protein [Hylemonella sp.]|nr:DUF2946 domain-containing protein [Hylemonella sp.]